MQIDSIRALDYHQTDLQTTEIVENPDRTLQLKFGGTPL